MEKIRYGLIGLACVGLVACGGNQVKTQEVSQLLEPANPPVYQVGNKYSVTFDGGEAVYEVVSVDGEKFSWKDDQGATWTRQGPFIYPPLEWKNETAHGQFTITSVEGEIFPLEVGNSVTFKGKASRTITKNGTSEKQYTWQEERDCKVQSQERVNVPAGSFDTFKVFCRARDVNSRNRRSVDRTWYYAPKLGVTVIYHQKNHFKRESSVQELVSFERKKTL